MAVHRELFQDLSSGKVELVEVPDPLVTDNHVLIRNMVSVISPGTEKMLLNFGKASLLGKVRQQPDRVKDVIRKIKSDGLADTYGAVQNRLQEPLPLGYSSSGEVVAVGRGVQGIRVGDLVASNSSHSELALVSQNFVVKIPKTVSPEDAAFVTLGSVSMQGVRLAQPAVGESVVVIGAGVVGLIAGQILLAAGCRTVLLDISSRRLELGKSFGLETVLVSSEQEAIDEARHVLGSAGADAVLIATSSSDESVLRMAAAVARKRAHVVLIGTAGMTLSRSDFYEKELIFQVSSSYGPGRNDPVYESGKTEYPEAYVRWTANRNMRSVARLMETGSLAVKPLVTENVAFAEAVGAYERLLSDREIMTVAIEYESARGLVSVPTQRDETPRPERPERVAITPSSPARVNLLGAGNFSKRTLLPVLLRKDVKLGIVASQSGTTAAHVKKRFGFEEATAEPLVVVSDRNADAIFLTTRHNTHAGYAVDALGYGLSVYVEKPLALSRDELEGVRRALTESMQRHPGVVLTVGFNRRYSPHVIEAKRLFENVSAPKTISMRVNGGKLTAEHWVLDRGVGGGRILSEGVHFIDLARYLVGNKIVAWTAVGSNQPETGDCVITLVFADASIATIEYLVSSSNKLRKERIEISSQGKSFLIDNFRRVQAYGPKAQSRKSLLRQDKGHSGAVDAFLSAVSDAQHPPIPYEEIFEVSGIAIDIAEQLSSKEVTVATWQR